MATYGIYSRVDGLGGTYCAEGHGWKDSEAADLGEAIRLAREAGPSHFIIREADGAAYYPAGPECWLSAEGEELDAIA